MAGADEAFALEGEPDRAARVRTGAVERLDLGLAGRGHQVHGADRLVAILAPGVAARAQDHHAERHAGLQGLDRPDRIPLAASRFAPPGIAEHDQPGQQRKHAHQTADDHGGRPDEKAPPRPGRDGRTGARGCSAMAGEPLQGWAAPDTSRSGVIRACCVRPTSNRSDAGRAAIWAGVGTQMPAWER